MAQLSRLYNQEPGDISSVNKIEADIDQIINHINGGMDTDNITDLAVITAKIADLAVTTIKLAESAVTTSKIADLNVITEKLADLAVTTAKLADSAVTDPKIGNRTMDQDITTAENNTGDLTTILSWIAKHLRKIKGTANWSDDSPVTLTDAKAHINSANPHSNHETPAGAQAKANIVQDNLDTHKNSNDHDERYYTEHEMDDKLSLKADKDDVVNSVDGVSGNVDFVEGTGINIASDPESGVITFTATTEAVPGPHMHNDDEINIMSTPDQLISTSLSGILDEIGNLLDEVVDITTMDTNGYYTVVRYKRKDGTLYMVSTLSDPDENGNYLTDTWKMYDRDGTTLVKTIVWSLGYDTNGNIISKSGVVS